MKEVILHLLGRVVLCLKSRGDSCLTLFCIFYFRMDNIECPAEEGWFAEDYVFLFGLVRVDNPLVPLEPDKLDNAGLVVEVGRQPSPFSDSLWYEAVYFSPDLNILHICVKLLHLVEAGFVDVLVREVVDQVAEGVNVCLSPEEFGPFRAYPGKEFDLTVKQFRHRARQKRLSPKIVNFGRESNELPEEMNLHAASAYATHMLKARSAAGHGVHSPFMFGFITEVIGGRSDRAIMKEVKSLRREMLADRRVVQVRDLGAGSVVMKERGKNARQDGSGRGEDPGKLRGGSTGAGERSSQEGEPDNGGYPGDPQDVRMQVMLRKIRDIASAAAVPEREAALLARIAGSLDKVHWYKRGSGGSHTESTLAGQLPVVEAGDALFSASKHNGDKEPARMNSGNLEHEANNHGDHGSVAGSGIDDRPVILELGTSLGISTLALALGAPDRRVISAEGCPELAAIARENLQRHGARNAEVMCMEFGQALALLRNRGTKVALAYIDGNHRGAALIEYVHMIREMGEEMIIIADDIHMNRDMIRAWQCLSEGNIAPASLETFRLGMLFCLRNLTPGHYRVR